VLSREVLETELVLASQMRSLAHVYGVLAHDLKAPLNAMQLALDLLGDSLANPEPPEGAAAGERRQRYLAILREELARLDRTLRAMLEQKEPVASVPGTCDLREIIQEISRVLLPLARRQRVEVRLDLPEGAVTATGYRDRLKQALLNLALRGLEAMPDGGRLGMSAAMQGDTVVVTVEDTGPGLPPALLDETFKARYTSGKSASSIGLYTARLVVESHGGEIADEGRPGEGTRFRVSLPRR
jgi:two-component system, NtrC family, sensor histidine kinase HydH